MSIEHFDVLIVGAGLSGIGAAYHLQTKCKPKRYAILEGRAAIGGTWDLFRYPGIRSDSDMYTLGYSFRPWRDAKAIADGSAILRYVNDAAREYGIESKIRFNHRVKRAQWSSDEAKWTVDCEVGEGRETVQLSCNFLFLCSGYYDYERGFTPEFDGAERYTGRIVHPQKWTNDIEYAGKRVIVIGSGATAVTLVPALAAQAAHVTMLQRSPSYIVSMPDRDVIADGLRRYLPAKLAYGITRWKNVLFGMLFFRLSRRNPKRIKAWLVQRVQAELGKDFDVATHFTPRYNPWDQRLCLVPNSDLFRVIREGRASVVTGHIECFTEKGLKLRSGAELEAELIVTATGLNLLPLGGMRLAVDGSEIDLGATVSYKGTMISGVPNLAVAFGYTNASWTLKSDLTCEYVCRLINYMDQHGHRQCTPRMSDPTMPRLPFIDFSSGYVQRAISSFPKQGPRFPWRLYQNYALDIFSLRVASLRDDELEFSRPEAIHREETKHE